MGESTELRDQTLPRAAGPVKSSPFARVWEKTRHGLARAAFWSYERGTWQYDLIVLAILAFIFVTPRSWFQDRPTLQLTDLRHHQGFVEVGHGKDGWSYLVDSRLVESWGSEKPEDAIREIMRLRLKKRFTIKSIVSIRGQNEVILGYTVVVVFQ